jgi:hypothetical protein
MLRKNNASISLDIPTHQSIMVYMMNDIDFSVYWVLSWERTTASLRFKAIPIQYLEQFKRQYKGRRMHLRWRGPRKHRIGARGRWLAQSVCLREDAVTFSVYQR